MGDRRVLRSLAWCAVIACSGSDDAGSTPSTSTADTGPTPEAVCLEGELSLAPFLGSYGLTPLVEDGDLLMQQGPQGGYHVDVSGVISPIPSTGVVVRGTLTVDGDGTVVAATDGVQVAFVRWEACEGEFQGARVFLDVALDAEILCGFVGEPATFELEVEDLVTGRSVAQTFGVTLDLALANGDCSVF